MTRPVWNDHRPVIILRSRASKRTTFPVDCWQGSSIPRVKVRAAKRETYVAGGEQCAVGRECKRAHDALVALERGGLGKGLAVPGVQTNFLVL